MQTTSDVKGYYDYVFLRKKVNEISSIIAEILPKNKMQRIDSDVMSALSFGSCKNVYFVL